MAKTNNNNVEMVCKNKKANYLYNIEKTIEAGLVLKGSEVKSLREKNADISDAYAVIKNGEAFLLQSHIAPYRCGGYQNHSPKRERKLLLHKKEIMRLQGRLTEKGYTLVPISIYFKRGKAKVLLGVARGKKKFDRRKQIMERDAKRQMKREMKRGTTIKY